LLALYGLTASGSVGPRISDGRSMFAVTAALVDRHALDVQPAALGVAGRGGLSYSKYGPGQSLVTLPLYLAGSAIAAARPAGVRLQTLMMACSFLNALLVALLCTVLPLLARRMGLAAPGTAWWLGLLAGLTTPLWPYAQIYFSEPLIALCLVLALLALWPACSAAPSRRTLPLLGCGTALGLAALTRLDSLVYVPIYLLSAALLTPCPDSRPLDIAPGRATRYPSLATSGRAALLVLLPIVLAVAGLAWYNAVRFGSPLDSGYGHGAQGEDVDLDFQRSAGYVLEGMWDLLASPGKGLIFYAPLVILVPWGIWRLWRGGRRGPVTVLLALCVATWVAHANLLIRWLGGWAWGPRFLVPVVPLLVLLAGGVLYQRRSAPAVRGLRALRARRLAVAVLALAGLLVQLPAVAADYHPYLDALSQRYSRYPGDPAAPYRAEDAYVPSFSLSPIVGQWRLVLDPAIWRDQPDWGRRAAEAVSGDRADGPHYAAPVPHTWWAILASESVPWSSWIWLLALFAVLGLGGAFLAALSTRRLYGRATNGA
jgi:hypothetical protein